MKLVVGLGNPGEKYVGNRHNVGFTVVETLAGGKSWRRSASGLLEYVWLPQFEVELIKPQTFMNRSGEAVRYVCRKHTELTPQDVWVVHDDLDIVLGEYKIQLGKGPKLHGGIQSIEARLGSQEFWRVRVGVEHRDRSVGIPGDRYVLADFLQEERQVVEEVIARIIDELTRRFL